MKRPGNRIVSIILAFILLFSLSGNTLAESGGLSASRSFAADVETDAEVTEETAETETVIEEESVPEETPEAEQTEETDEESVPEETPEAEQEQEPEATESEPEQTEEEIPADAPEEVPADAPAMRTITAQTYETAFFDEHGNTAIYTDRVNSFWGWLFEREPHAARDRDPAGYVPYDGEVTVEVTGILPADVTAAAYYTAMAEENIYSEKALIALDIELLDGQGQLYVPQEALTITVGGPAVAGAVAQDKALLVYDCRVNEERQEILGEYAVDVRVLRNGFVDENRLRYRGEKGDSQAVLFAEDPNGLAESEDDGTVSFAAENVPLHLILAEQVRERTIAADTQDKAADVELTGALSENTTVSAAVSYADEISVQTDGTGLVGVDISLEDTETGAYSPDTPIEVAITDASIGEALNRESDLEVWRLDGAYGPEKVEEAQFYGNTAAFQAEGAMSYVIVETYLEKTLETTDGEVYLISVSYDARSGLPANAELYVDEIKEGDAGYEQYVEQAAAALGEKSENLTLARAFDITLKDPKTGEVCQPNENVQVRIRLLNEDLNSYAAVDVVHIHGEDEKQVDLMETTVSGEAVEFSADGFSVYVLAGSNGETVTPQCTYTFWVPSEDTGGYKEYALIDAEGRTVYRQIITKGEELIVPQLVSTEDRTFAGWYERLSDGEGGYLLAAEPYDFDHITITENSAVDLCAVYTSYATVYFHDQYDTESGSFPLAYTRRAELSAIGEGLSAKVKISDLGTTYLSSDGSQMAFCGWSETPVTTPGAAVDDSGNAVALVAADEDGCITVTGEKHLYPVYKGTHWLTYYAAQSGLRAAYVPPAQFFAGDPVTYDDDGETVYSLPVTSRDGYAFLGWWTGTLSTNGSVETVNYGSQITESDGSLVATADDSGAYISGGKLYLRSNVTLYAKWAASYSIVYWKQVTTESPDTAEKHYEYAETVKRTAQIGDTASVAETDRPGNKYDGYRLGHYDAPALIGNTLDLTVLNVYYDLAEPYAGSAEPHTLAFRDSVSGAGASGSLPKEYNVSYGTSLLTGHEGGSFIPADPVPGRKSESGKDVYRFSGWYMDQACTIRVFFETPTAAQLSEIDGQKYTVMSAMPDHDTVVYAGWTPIRFSVDIDPNYGALYYEDGSGNLQGTGATYFSSTYDDEPIGEYTHVNRDYVESSSGTWYYVNHDRAYGGADRYTYYTRDPALATGDTTYEYTPGVYTRAGWYEVLLDENGNEIGEASAPYDFSRHTDHNTKLRLHWKKAGTYYLTYDAGDGTMEAGGTSFMPEDGFADYASVVLNQSAKAPEGDTFIGWRVRGDESGVIYKPGQSFTLHAKDATRVRGKDVVFLDAVYVRVGTAVIVYDANGGTVESTVDFGGVPGSGSNTWEDASGIIDAAKGTATVSGLTNNSRIRLSNGNGFTAPAGSGAVFLGWSDKAVCDDSAVFYSKDSTDKYAVNTDEPVTLYAVWGVQVSYALNSENAEWGEPWDPAVYTQNGNLYSQTVHLGVIVSEPVNVPVYNGADQRMFRYWATRSGEGTEGSPYIYEAYDFSRPVTGALDLYAYWSEPETIPVHAVDASDETLRDVDVTVETGWSANNVTVTAAETVLDGTSHVTAPEGYEFAFAAVSDDLTSVSDHNAVAAVKYENKKVKVRYSGESAFRVLGEGMELYFVYYEKKALGIGCKSMESSGVLSDVEALAVPETTEKLGACSMSELIPDALDGITGFTYYAFAIGSADPGGETPMNASNMSLITDTAGAGDPAPTLRIRNTWRGFEYTTDAGADAEWIRCGYEPQLYVIYFTQHPTVIQFSEKTIGTEAVMDTPFAFDLLVTETTTTTVSVQTQVWTAGTWENDGDPAVTATTGAPVTIFDTGSQPYILKDGEENSCILFYSKTINIVEGDDDGTGRRTVTTTTTVTAQTVEITQTPNDSFTTSINGVLQENAPCRYTYTTDGTGVTQNVTFTNTHKSLPVEIHAALVEGDGILQRDAAYRSTTEEDYMFDLEPGASETLLAMLPPAELFTGSADTYAFGAVMYGTGSEDSAVVIESMDVAAVAYEQTADNGYELVLKDSGGNTIGELGSNKLYYLYYPMPRIRYVKEAADGTLTDVTGCLYNSGTGSVEASDSVTYNHAPLTMNGKTVTQNQSVEIPLSGFVISQNGNSFRMPPLLDDGVSERYLNYMKLGTGAAGAANSADLDVSTGRTMQIRVQDNTLKYSFDGTVWKNLILNGTPTIYAVYNERGYDLQISKTVDTSQSGENAIFSDASFTVTITSAAITKDSYDAEGADGATVAATPASGSAPGSIVLAVTDGTRVRIKGLGHGDYTITESGNENYTLTAKTGSIVGGSTTTADVLDNTTVSIAFNTETKIDLTNSPKAICRIGGRYFYTLRSMVEYVDQEIPTKTATAEMLTDYLMPEADTVEIPGDCNITLTTAESVGRVAVITRPSGLADEPLFTNNGTLAFTNLTLEGNSVEATAPMIQSAGDLTIGSGAVVQNGTGGGAVKASAGNITVSGTIRNCSAEEGGAIYHSGNSTISLTGTGSIQNNTAASGNGGAIWLANGTIELSGTSRISGNAAASGNGGAIYANEVVEIRIFQGGGITGNTAMEGGAIYAQTGTIEISETAGVAVKPAVTGNTATEGSGGAIYVSTGSVTVSGGSVSNNKAENGSGGAVYTNTASVTISGTAEVKANKAGKGGAVHAVSGAVNVTGGTVESNTATDGNGGAILADSGNVTVSGGSMSKNNAAGSGGAVSADSGSVTISNVSITGNTAGSNGGAVYAESGSLTLTSVTATGNSAVNGAAVFTDSGRAVFNAGSYTENTASDGGAVGAGSIEARLVFTGDVQIRDNKLGTGDAAPKSNVYLDQDDDAVINIDTLGTGASIGVYVADSAEDTRGVPGARFAVYINNGNVNRITNDRYPSLTVQSDTAAKKLYWGSVIKVSVHTLNDYGSSFTQPANAGAGTQLGKYDSYYPELSDAAISELATELVNKNNLNIGTRVYAGAYLDGARSFGDYITQLLWDKDTSEWCVTTHSGETVYLNKTDGTGSHRIYIYYAEPAYLSIENNTDMELSVSDMTIDGASVINSDTEAGYGMVFARNGAIRAALLPVTAEDLTLSPGQSVNLLIPGGRNKPYTLGGSFQTTEAGSVRLRRGAEGSLSEDTVTVPATGVFAPFSGTTLNTADTFQIIFGDDKYICKVVDADGVEHPYSKISAAIADITATAGSTPPYTLETEKTAVIEMLTDYLLTASDDVNIPQGYDITLTTAAKEGAVYCYNGTGSRATISRDSQNTNSMIKAWNALANNRVVTTLRLKDLIFDGKSVRGSSDGGAVATQYTNVYIDTVDFKNVYASNGGALLVMFHFNRTNTKENKATLAGTILEVRNSDFTGCSSTTTVTSNRLGGGAIVTNAETMTLESCDFSSCTAVDQAGAVFHRVDGNYNSWTNVTGCTFTNCSANAAGGLELDSKTIVVADTTFNHCVATARNGGGFNVYALNAASPTNDCWVTVSGCTFNDCQLTTTSTNNGNGGGFRSNAVYTKVENSTFTNNLALFGGGFCISNANAKKGEVYGCTFERNSARQGGGIYGKPLEFIIGDYTYTGDDGAEQVRHTEIKNCTSTNEGGGIWHNNTGNSTSLSITNAAITGNRATNNRMNGGGIYASVRTLTLHTAEISRNNATGSGGGVWFDFNSDDVRNTMSLTVEGCTLNEDTAGANGGGIYTMAKTVEIKAYTEGTGESAAVTPTTISNCTANNSGGGLYQSREVEGSTLTVTDSVISGCNANDRTTNNNPPQGGGGIMAIVKTITVTGSEIKNNTAVRIGGGINAPSNSTSSHLIIDGTQVTGNTAGNMGGGIYTRSQLTLRNGTQITGNWLNSDPANCAGVYLLNGRTLFVGPEDAEEGFTDTVIVRGNKTNNAALSDLRLWDNGSENNAQSVYVYCNLSNDSEIRVVNAAKVSTWFGSSEIAQPNGFSDENAVFRADSSTLHGIIDRTDPTMKKIIWGGPPIAKLTDGEGNLLYLKYNEGGAAYPAIFDRLDTGDANAASPISPFSLLRTNGLTLYYRDGSVYEGSDYCVKMLVEHYEVSKHITLSYVEGRNVTFTTAQKSDADYPYEGPAGGRSTVIRSAGVGNNSLLTAAGNLTLSNIFIDGGSENGINAAYNTRNLQAGSAGHSITVTLGEGAVLQNARSTGPGSGVNVTDNTTFEIRGGVIRNCATTVGGTDGGGGVYLNVGTVVFEAGSIYQCSANCGGGVRIKNGTMNMTGGTISGCSANQGGGVYVGGGHTLNMSGGSIVGNSAKNNGGGVAIFTGDQVPRLYFSGKVNISGNTCDASVAPNKACNVELNRDSNGVINTNNGGLYPGAYIGVYVNGNGANSNYDKHGVERKPFGTFAAGDNTTYLYSFVNDRNGLKGGIIEKPAPNTIYWIQIFSLSISKEVEAGRSTVRDPEEQFLFKVIIRGNATVAGQLNAAQIDSDEAEEGKYGEMHFDSNGVDTTTAVFALKDGESITGINLSEGLTYEVIEYLTLDQARRYAAMPMEGSSTTAETLTVDGTEYTVVRANTYSSTIGENKARTDVDPYTSALTFTNRMPVCKLTDMNGNLLYRKYDWDKVTNKASEKTDGGSSTDQPVYYAPAVYTELTGGEGAFKALEGTLYATNGSNPTSYDINNGVKIQMLIDDYVLSESISVDRGKVTLCTASGSDALFPMQGSGTAAVIHRAFADNSMFRVSADLTLSTITIDGERASYLVLTDGGIANVANGGKLTIQDGATLRNSRTGSSGGAVYAAAGSLVTMTGGVINKNESVGDGGGIYLAAGSTLNLSGTPGFGGTGRDVSGNITTANGNFKTGELIAENNGGKQYAKARQDIFIAETQEQPASVVLTGDVDVDAGSIWIWAAHQNHYAMMKPFARIERGTASSATYAAFRNAQPDSVTGCGGDTYLSGSSGENTMLVYWAGGFDIGFMKIDSFGSAQAGAVFTLYANPDCTETVKQKGADASAVSADDGAVLFEQIPGGIYYMKETTVPEGYVNAHTKDSQGNPVSNVYVVLAGDSAMQQAGSGVLADITREQITAQTGTGEDQKDAAVFLIDPATGQAAATPDIAAYGIMNIRTAERKAILRKVGEKYVSLQGAAFQIHRADMTLVKDGTQDTFTSDANGIFRVGMLPYGIYFVHEVTVPDGYAKNGENGWWFTVRVDANGTTIVSGRSRQPVKPD